MAGRQEREAGGRDVSLASLAVLADEVVGCRRCPRLVAWREAVASERRASYQDQDYWGRPITGFGDPDARLVVVGLAPAAHGGNRTGRIFTGDRSGDWLWAAMWRAGLANQPTSTSRDDGLAAIGAWVTAVVRCAPPGNRPLPEERDNCLPYLEAEVALLPQARCFLALGGFAYQALWASFGLGRRPPFSHGAEVALDDGRYMVASYHPSQQNTFTGRLNVAMLDQVVARAAHLAGLAAPPTGLASPPTGLAGPPG